MFECQYGQYGEVLKQREGGGCVEMLVSESESCVCETHPKVLMQQLLLLGFPLGDVFEQHDKVVEAWAGH